MRQKLDKERYSEREKVIGVSLDLGPVEKAAELSQRFDRER
jgi:hypothetical protein